MKSVKIKSGQRETEVDEHQLRKAQRHVHSSDINGQSLKIIDGVLSYFILNILYEQDDV